MPLQGFEPRTTDPYLVTTLTELPWLPSECLLQWENVSTKRCSGKRSTVFMIDTLSRKSYCRKRKRLWSWAPIGNPDAGFLLSSVGRGLAKGRFLVPMSTKEIHKPWTAIFCHKTQQVFLYVKRYVKLIFPEVEWHCVIGCNRILGQIP